MLTRNFILILLGNIILGSAMPMLIILGGLAGAWLAPQSWLATAPPSAQMISGILVAAPISLFMGRFGRRVGFLLGAAMLCVGGLLGALALVVQSFPLLCVAHVILGGALICVNYFRFAASDAVSLDFRPQAISLTLASGLIAALIGPELFSLSKDALSPTPMAGAYGAMAALGLIGSLPVLGLSMGAHSATRPSRKTMPLREVLSANPRITAAIGIAALSQAMMVFLMVPTPLAMIGCGFADDQAADVIRWHVVAMFAPGFFTGSLIKRFGAGRIAAMGIALLVFSALVAWSGLTILNFTARSCYLGLAGTSASSAEHTCSRPPSAMKTVRDFKA
ncbi:MFS transporter [Sagittula sp. S175]|uniref:MFS transporter n=1 Tax=Sagittula sp. S175 TaxID=3415129 RepID=UPI003C7D68CA